MSETPAFRMVKEDAAEPQKVFRFAQPDGDMVLALPPGDVERWCGTEGRKLKRKRLVIVDLDWYREDRFRKFLQRVREQNERDLCGQIFALACVAKILCDNFEAVGLGKVGILVPDEVLWQFRLGEGQRVQVNTAIERAIAEQLLQYVSSSDATVTRDYRPYARPGKPTEDDENARTCARSARTCARRRDETSTRLDETGFESDVDGAREAAVDYASPPAARHDDDAKALMRKASEATTNDARATNDDAAGPITLPGSEIVISRRDPRNAMAGIHKWLAAERARLRRKPWPAPHNAEDAEDFQRAVFNAVETMRLPLLLELLFKTAEWASDGRGFRSILRNKDKKGRRIGNWEPFV